MKKTVLTPFVVLLFTLVNLTFANTQTAVGNAVKEWERAKASTKEFLDAMPENSYGSRPTPEMRSFAEQMLLLPMPITVSQLQLWDSWPPKNGRSRENY